MHSWYENKVRFISALFFVLFITTVSIASTRISSGAGATKADSETNAAKEGLRVEIEKIVTSTHFEKNADRIESVFISNYQSYLLSRKTLETRDQFGVVQSRVRIEANRPRIMKILKEEGMLPKSAAKPRIMILLDERVEGEPAFERSATFELEKMLTRQGFTVVEPEQMKKVKEQEKMLSMNQDALATLAFRSGADLILKGQVSVGKAREQTIYGTTQFSVPVQLNVRVVRSDNAEIVLARTKSTRKTSQDEFSAAQIALKVGGQDVGKAVGKELTAIWEDDLSSPKKLELMVTGSNLSKVEKALASNSSIISSEMRYLEDKTALYDIKISGTVQELRTAVGAIPGWEVTLVTANRLGIGEKTASPTKVSYEYHEPEILISSFTVEDIFPSRGRFYEENPIASVVVDLKEGATINNLAVSVTIPELMDLPTEKRIKSVGAGSTTPVDLTLLMNNKKLLANREERKVTGKAVISFYQNGKKVTRELSIPVVLHDANAMDWAEASSIASFVTYRNSTVDRFARSAIISVDKTGFNDQFEEALAIFTALNKYGITYVKDPIPSGDARILDKVQYPLETLEKKSGDCDDSSVLMASLLSAIGINVAFISYPDHVLIMFDTGVYKKNRFKLGVDAKNVVIHNNRCWIPVETTLLKKDFFHAWRTAASEYHQAIADGQPIEISELQPAWKSFPAFNYARVNETVKAPQIAAAAVATMESVKSALKKEIQTEIQRLEYSTALSMKEQNYLGILYARSGDPTKAVNHFEGLMKEKELPILANNLACAYMLSGDESTGLKMVEQSLAMKKTAPALVNKALGYYLASSTPDNIEEFVAAMIDANNALPSGVTLADMLGIELVDGNGDRAAGEHEAEKAQTIDKRRLQELLKKRVLGRNLSKEAKEKGVTVNVNVMPFGGVRGADPTQVAVIADLLFWME